MGGFLASSNFGPKCSSILGANHRVLTTCHLHTSPLCGLALHHASGTWFALTLNCCFAYMADGPARNYVYLRSPSQLLTAGLSISSLSSLRLVNPLRLSHQHISTFESPTLTITTASPCAITPKFSINATIYDTWSGPGAQNTKKRTKDVQRMWLQCKIPQGAWRTDRMLTPTQRVPIGRRLWFVEMNHISHGPFLTLVIGDCKSSTTKSRIR